jgi:DNA polymerase
MATPAQRREALKAVWHEARECTRCPLADTRTTVVFGNGDADADLMFVGEAPGANEDREGLPFVGQAGKLLDKLLGEIGMDRGQVFVLNVLKCRPPGNRDPQPGEIEACSDYLFQQVELIEPLVVCTLGNFATKLLRGDSTGITRLHGQAEVRTIGPRIPALLAEPAPEQPAAVEELEVPEVEPEALAAPEAPAPEPRGEPEPAPQLGLF